VGAWRSEKTLGSIKVSNLIKQPTRSTYICPSKVCRCRLLLELGDAEAALAQEGILPYTLLGLLRNGLDRDVTAILWRISVVLSHAGRADNATTSSIWLGNFDMLDTCMNSDLGTYR
jgi:hypothetical protein